eukprot:1188341-Prorocentrum_minimum.AAC.3
MERMEKAVGVPCPTLPTCDVSAWPPVQRYLNGSALAADVHDPEGADKALAEGADGVDLVDFAEDYSARLLLKAANALLGMSVVLLIRPLYYDGSSTTRLVKGAPPKIELRLCLLDRAVPGLR